MIFPINTEFCFQVTLVAGLCHGDAVLVSHGHFEANSNGFKSLLHTPSVGGTYTGDTTRPLPQVSYLPPYEMQS